MNQAVNLYEDHYHRRYLLITQISFLIMSFILFITIGNFIKLLETKQELKQYAVFDQLTELYNRRKFNQLLEDELAREDRYEINLSVIMFDIDHFKQINDEYGHDIEDEVLVQLADLIKENKREVDVLARWGEKSF